MTRPPAVPARIRGSGHDAPPRDTARQLHGSGFQPSTYGLPSPALLARANRGLARFLAPQGEDQDHQAASSGHIQG